METDKSLLSIILTSLKKIFRSKKDEENIKISNRCEDCKVKNAFKVSMWEGFERATLFGFTSFLIPDGKRAVIESITANLSLSKCDGGSLEIRTTFNHVGYWEYNSFLINY